SPLSVPFTSQPCRRPASRCGFTRHTSSGSNGTSTARTPLCPSISWEVKRALPIGPLTPDSCPAPSPPSWPERAGPRTASPCPAPACLPAFSQEERRRLGPREAPRLGDDALEHLLLGRRTKNGRYVDSSRCAARSGPNHSSRHLRRATHKAEA